MKRSRWLAAAVCALLAIVAGAPAASAQGSNGLEWKDCALVPDIVVQCAAQTVPLDYDRPNGKTIDIAVARVPAKDHRSQPGLVERFEAFAGGMELANAFSELNDPDEQRARFEAQRRFADEGHEEAMPFDEAYLQALELGLPPTGGIGIGIDRLVMLLTGKRTIREVVLFPAMRD